MKLDPVNWITLWYFSKYRHLLTEFHMHIFVGYTLNSVWYVVCRMSHVACFLFCIFHFRIPISKLLFSRSCVLCTLSVVHVFLQYCQPLRTHNSPDTRILLSGDWWCWYKCAQCTNIIVSEIEIADIFPRIKGPKFSSSHIFLQQISIQ